MSLDLSVVTDKRITAEQMKTITDYLLDNRFSQDEYGFYSEGDKLSINIYPDMEPEKDEFWNDGPPRVVWFLPLMEIALESRHNGESHETCYHIAKDLAQLIDGFIYDNQVGAIYDSDGQPCDHFKTGKVFEPYGVGIELFMRCVGSLNDILDVKK